MALRKLEGTHRFLNMLVCDRCGYKVAFDQAGRPVMRDHLAAKHPPANGSDEKGAAA